MSSSPQPEEQNKIPSEEIKKSFMKNYIQNSTKYEQKIDDLLIQNEDGGDTISYNQDDKEQIKALKEAYGIQSA